MDSILIRLQQNSFFIKWEEQGWMASHVRQLEEMDQLGIHRDVILE
jgi:hypothetical protein